MNNLQVIEHKEVRVLTTQQLAEVYGTTNKVISNNFNRNKERYLEGKHFYYLQGEEFNQFLQSSNLGTQISNMSRSTYLWTERGAFLHAKSLNTDQAWEVYDKLVEFYFKAQTTQLKLDSYMIEDPIKRAERWIEEAKEREILLLEIEKKDKRLAKEEVLTKALGGSDDSISVGELAKILNKNGYKTGQKRLFAQLRKEGYLMRDGKDNVPTQRASDLSIIEIVESVIIDPNGGSKVRLTPKITGKGQAYFIKRYLRKDISEVDLCV